MVARSTRLLAGMLVVVACGALAGQANAFLYRSSRGPGTVVRADLDGTGAAAIANGQSIPQGVAVSGRRNSGAYPQGSSVSSEVTDSKATCVWTGGPIAVLATLSCTSRIDFVS